MQSFFKLLEHKISIAYNKIIFYIKRKSNCKSNFDTSSRH